MASEQAPAQVVAETQPEADDLKGLAVVGKRSMSSLIPIGEKGIVLQNYEDLLRFAKHVATFGTLPKGMTEGGAALAIQAGLERSMGPLWGIQACVVINGVLSWRGWAAKALMQQSPVVVKGSLRSGCSGEGDAMVGWCEAKRVGYEQPFRREFSVKDAIRAGLWGKEGPWKSYPAGQLEWRAVGFLLRFDFGDVGGGLPLMEEAADYVDLPATGGVPVANSRRETPVVASKPDTLIEKLKAQAKPTVAPEVAQARVEAKPGAAVIDVTPVEAKAAEPVIDVNPVRPGQFPPTPTPVEELTLTPPPFGCQHAPAREYLKAHKRAKNVVCEDCTLTVKLQEDGSLIVV